MSCMSTNGRPMKSLRFPCPAWRHQCGWSYVVRPAERRHGPDSMTADAKEYLRRAFHGSGRGCRLRPQRRLLWRHSPPVGAPNSQRRIRDPRWFSLHTEGETASSAAYRQRSRASKSMADHKNRRWSDNMERNTRSPFDPQEFGRSAFSSLGGTKGLGAAW